MLDTQAQTSGAQHQGIQKSGGAGGGGAPPSDSGAEGSVQMMDSSLNPSAQSAAPVMSHWVEDGGPAAPAAGPRPTLQLGGRGEHVVALQQQLNGRGAALTPDGSFGPMTRTAVVSFQQGAGLVPDGVVGPATWGALGEGGVATGGGGGTGTGGGATTGGGTGTGGATTGAGATTGTTAGQGTGATTTTGAGPATGTGTTTGTGTPDPAQGAAFDAEAPAHLQALQAKGAGAAAGGGHTEARGVASFPPWFTEIQNLLINTRAWGDAEENAQQFLHRYVDWRQRSGGGPLPANVVQFLRFIGRSEANQKAAKAGGKSHTGELTGAEGASNWCQGASTVAMKMVMDEIGVGFASSYEKWLQGRNKGAGSSRTIGPPAAHGAPLDPGDIFSLIGPSTPPSGHVATCMDDRGDSILMVSGNAGGGGGSVRIDEAKRGQPPGGYSYWKAVEMGNKGEQVPPSWHPPSGSVWVVTIQKVGNMVELLDRMRGMDRSSAEFQALLKEYDLVQKAPKAG